MTNEIITRDQVSAVLAALGEEFLVDIPAIHNGKGDYKLDYFELSHTLVDAPPAWLDRIVGYVNSKELTDAA